MLPSRRSRVTNEPDSEANASNETFLSSTPRPLSASLTTTTATAGDAGDDPYSETEPRWKRTRFIEQLETQSDSLGHPLSRALGYNSLAFRSLRETNSPGWSLYSNFAREHPVSALPQPYQGLQHRSSLQAAAFPTGHEQGHIELSSSSRFSLLHLPTLGQPPSQSPTIQPTNQNHTFASTETFSVEALVQQHLQNGSFLHAGVLTSIEGRLHVAKGSLPVSVGAYLARTLPPTNHASVVPAFQMSSRRSVNALPATTGPHKGLQRNDALQALRIVLMEGGIDLEASATAPFNLPRPLALLEDNEKLSLHQVFLRFHIEAFKASEEDISTIPVGGIELSQRRKWVFGVGIARIYHWQRDKRDPYTFLLLC